MIRLILVKYKKGKNKDLRKTYDILGILLRVLLSMALIALFINSIGFINEFIENIHYYL